LRDKIKIELKKQYKYIRNIYISKMKDYVKRAIDNYRTKHREEYLEYQKAYKKTDEYKLRCKQYYLKVKNADKRIPEFKLFCKIYE
jgi:hypothetical protein